MFRIPVVRRSQKSVPQNRTAVVGISDGCGVSFVAGSLAWSLSLQLCPQLILPSPSMACHLSLRRVVNTH